VHPEVVGSSAGFNPQDCSCAARPSAPLTPPAFLRSCGLKSAPHHQQLWEARRGFVARLRGTFIVTGVQPKSQAAIKNIFATVHPNLSLRRNDGCYLVKLLVETNKNKKESHEN